jgi:Na+-translocating ferredoxin:NAD+ oxidoreductase subunit G
MKTPLNKNLKIMLPLYLLVLTVTCGVILFALNNITAPRIKAIQIKERNNALKQVLPIAESYTGFDESIDMDKQMIFKGLGVNNKLVGYVFLTKPKGYGGKLQMLVGVRNKKLTGCMVLSHTETPGLGALATSKKNLKGKQFSFLGQFLNRSINETFKAKQDYISLTGATITSQAIGDGISLAIKSYKNISIVK